MPLFAIVAITALLVSFLPSPAHATLHGHGAPSAAPQCHARSGSGLALAAVVQAPRSGSFWNCSDEDWVAHEPVAWLLFDASVWRESDLPSYFFTRIARHDGISFAAVDRDGSFRTVSWEEEDGHAFAAGPVFQLELPDITESTETVIVRIVKPHSIPLLTEARLSPIYEDADWSMAEVLVLAFVIGMLVLPLFFDISFYIVLRERFVLLHATMASLMIAYVLFSGGLISAFIQLPTSVIAVAGPFLWAQASAVCALFLVSFLETGALSKTMRTLTLGTAAWTAIVPGFFALQLHATQAFDDRAYFITFLPVIGIIIAAIAEALWRGSRSARFLAVAWAPIIMACVERLLRGVGVYVGPSILDQLVYVASGIEVIVISLAIADRFLAIRRERDEAVHEARMLEHISERDPLTGLMNRRGLEERFDDLLRQGFDTFALVDLDRFKQVNDRHGHQLGDAALQACAATLVGGELRDTVAVRLGGEEFLLLLRGRGTVERAENIRQAIPVRIAREVPGLSLPVTASMGVIEVPRSQNTSLSFGHFYARADALMYEAKEAGRNRMSYERVTMFANPASVANEAANADKPDASTRVRRKTRGAAA